MIVFTEMILKIASRCDLACDYCYMYELGDNGWRQQPRFMSPAVIHAAASIAGDHVSKHDLSYFRIILHGGEPLLAGTDTINAIVNEFYSCMPVGVKLQFGMQSNGDLLTEEIMAKLPYELRIGISIDGDQQATTRHRRRVNNTDTHHDVVRALSLLQSHREQYGGTLSVIDLLNDPTVTYNAIREHTPPVADFLLPLATHDTPPPYHKENDVSYGKWLATLFDAWYLDKDPRAPIVRVLTLIVERLLGQDRRSGFIGPPPRTDSLVVQTDGSVELLDALRVTGDGQVLTNLSVLENTLDEVSQHPGYTPPEPCDTCKVCPVFEVCGGGYYPHRFSTVNGYDNPSVYCGDLMYLIRHIESRLTELTVTVDLHMV